MTCRIIVKAREDHLGTVSLSGDRALFVRQGRVGAELRPVLLSSKLDLDLGRSVSYGVCGLDAIGSRGRFQLSQRF